MKYGLLILALLFAGLALRGQKVTATLEGAVSYVTSQNVYVKFPSTEGIRTGDTLYFIKDGNPLPGLVVKDLSSISCVCVPLSGFAFKVSDKIVFTQKRAPETPPAVPPPVATKSSDTSGAVVPAVPPPAEKPADTSRAYTAKGPKSRQQIHGFINVASYTNWSNNTATNSQREKITFSLLARNIANTNLSAECYIGYYINPNQYNEVENSVFNQLKIFNFDFSYDFGKTATLLLGRKINPKLSNMGPNDGLQFELKFKPISVGIIAGFRPDYRDFGFDASLFQLGAYVYNEYAGKHGYMSTTLAFIDQTNNWKTDRRYFYLQHVNSLVKNLTFFGSVEMDIYGMTFNSADSTYTSNSNPKFTNYYLSLGYRPHRRVSLSFSYSARQNVIYYETYKSYLDRLLDSQTLQGYSLQASYNPVGNLSIGATAAYRFMPQDLRPTSNIYAYITYSEIPGINTTATISGVFLGTGYLNGGIYSAGLSKSLAKGKLYLGLTYRYVDYRYYSTEFEASLQNMGEFSLTWRIIRKLAFSVYYEGTFEKSYNYNRIYAQLNWGF